VLLASLVFVQTLLAVVYFSRNSETNGRSLIGSVISHRVIRPSIWEIHLGLALSSISLSLLLH